MPDKTPSARSGNRLRCWALVLIVAIAVFLALRHAASFLLLHEPEKSDVILVLEGGRVVEEGARAALAADPASRFAGLLRVGLEAEGVLA